MLTARKSASKRSSSKKDVIVKTKHTQRLTWIAMANGKFAQGRTKWGAVKNLLRRLGEDISMNVEFWHLANNRFDATIRGLDDGAQVIVVGVAPGHVRQGQLRHAQHRREQVVEVVGDAASQPTERLHLLG